MSAGQDARVEVAVVGAGPAGATCAAALLMAGARAVALIDRAIFPRDKSCGDGIGPGVVPILSALGMEGVLAGRVHATAMTMAAFDAAPAIFDSEAESSPLGYIVPRTDFDDYLCRTALARGAQDFTGTDLTGAQHEADGWRLTLRHAATGTTQTLHARVLVGADGARSRVRRMLGFPLGADADTGIAIRAYANAHTVGRASLRLDIRSDLPRPGYGWVFDDGRGQVNVGVGALATCFSRGADKPDALLARYAQSLNDTAEGGLRAPLAALLPMASAMPPLGDPGRCAALVGDAASMVNPLTGEGIYYGMQAALMLGERLGAALKTGSEPAAAITGYDDGFRALLGRHLRDACLLRRVLTAPPAMKLFCALAARSPRAYRDFIAFMFGPVPPARPPTLGGLVLSAMGPALRMAARPWHKPL